MGSAVRRLKHVDLCVEVFTNQGPVFGVLRNADRKGIEAIAEEVSDLDAKGKAGLLTPEESSGGTLAISDLSDFGVKNSTPLVFNNQAGTIAIGAVQQSAKIDGDDLKVPWPSACHFVFEYAALPLKYLISILFSDAKGAKHFVSNPKL
mmetsp:Transcript_7644/g.34018  ORF Transcript_7644/g.34018 Transcript_7644/m.34018 type:complete len:149 (-) Transcript_7644:631-1077(-)